VGQQLSRRLRSPPPAFAMISFGKICQLEIDSEGFRHLMRFGHIQTIYNMFRAGDQASHIVNVVPRFRV
jgi:hypothetical protein